MKLAVIDLGSNSARFGIYTYENGLNEIFRKRENTRLAQGLETDNMLKKEPMERTLKALIDFSEIIKEQKADEVLAISTESLRRAENSAYFVNLVKEKAGIEIKIIDGYTEALYGSFATKSSSNSKDYYFLDTGGGSFELGLVKNSRLEEFVCLPYGCVVLTEKFKPDEKGVEELNSFLYNKLSKLDWLKEPYPLVVLGGSVKEIAKLKFTFKKEDEINGKAMSDNEVFEIFNKIYSTPVSERPEKFNMEIKRADIITAGLCPTLNVLKITKSDKIIFCTKSVRDGAAEAFFNGKSL